MLCLLCVYALPYMQAGALSPNETKERKRKPFPAKHCFSDFFDCLGGAARMQPLHGHQEKLGFSGGLGRVGS